MNKGKIPSRIRIHVPEAESRIRIRVKMNRIHKTVLHEAGLKPDLLEDGGHGAGPLPAPPAVHQRRVVKVLVL